MSVSVRIPTILRTYTGGESEVSAEGGTLAEVLDDLDASYTGIKGPHPRRRRARSAGSSTSTSATTTCASSTASSTAPPRAPRSPSSRPSPAAERHHGAWLGSDAWHATSRPADRVGRDELARVRPAPPPGTLVTRRSDGSPQISPVTCGVDDEGRIVVSTYPQRAKAANLRRDPRGRRC